MKLQCLVSPEIGCLRLTAKRQMISISGLTTDAICFLSSFDVVHMVVVGSLPLESPMFYWHWKLQDLPKLWRDYIMAPMNLSLRLPPRLPSII